MVAILVNAWSASASEIESTTSEVLYVARSRAAKCPAPSERLHPYLLSGWDDARVATPTLELDDRKFPEDWNPCDENDLLSKFAAWREERQHWLHDEQERAKCNMLYERLYSWHHLIAFQPEVWEVVIGNGVLTYTPSQSDQSISTTDQLSETDNEEQSMVQNPELTSRPNPYAARKRSGQGRTCPEAAGPQSP